MVGAPDPMGRSVQGPMKRVRVVSVQLPQGIRRIQWPPIDGVAWVFENTTPAVETIGDDSERLEVPVGDVPCQVIQIWK